MQANILSQSAAGEFQSEGSHDELTAALGTGEHGGRVRGCSLWNTQKDVFAKTKRASRGGMQARMASLENSNAELRASNAALQTTLLEEMARLRAELSGQAPTPCGPVQMQPEMSPPTPRTQHSAPSPQVGSSGPNPWPFQDLQV